MNTLALHYLREHASLASHRINLGSAAGVQSSHDLLASGKPMAAASGVKLSHPSAGVLEVTNGPPVYTSLDQMPARFGKFGGRYIPETLAEAHDQLAAEYIKASQDPEFRLELEKLGRDYIGR